MRGRKSCIAMTIVWSLVAIFTVVLMIVTASADESYSLAQWILMLFITVSAVTNLVWQVWRCVHLSSRTTAPSKVRTERMPASQGQLSEPR